MELGLTTQDVSPIEIRENSEECQISSARGKLRKRLESGGGEGNRRTPENTDKSLPGFRTF